MIRLLDNNFTALNEYLAENTPSSVFFLVDENTHEYCLPQLLASLETEIPFEIIEITAGEEMKNLETAAQLWEILAEFNADRKALLINLGGGVITDLGGFVASTYKRGIKFINIPTTLLGMCDASIGGKTGIDHRFLKNIIGSFAEAEAVFLFPHFLKTLPFAELRSGFAEMLKHGLITDKQHWDDLCAIRILSAETISPYIKKSMQIKLDIVEKDFREEHLRKTLNFGHTVGHAVESSFLRKGAPILHGEAVAIGMITETHLSYLEKHLSEAEAGEIIQKIRRFFPAHDLSALDFDEICMFMKKDKKNSLDQINFSLLKSAGSCIYDATASAKNIFNALHFYQNLS